MRMLKDFIMLGTLILLAVTFGCGGSGGGDGSTTGTMSMSITDAKPLIPEPPGKVITNVFVTIDGVFVHKSGGGWLDLTEYLPDSPSPFVIDLMFYSNGTSTDLVPPVAIGSGKYTQVRLSVVNAKIVFDNDPDSANWVDLDIPSENLKTDQNFEFTVGGSAVDITIDFDLSKSIVVEGPAGNESYKLKPVLHIVETKEAATINVAIDNGKFDPVQNAWVTVLSKDENGAYTDEYTKIEVPRQDPPGTTTFSIYWLVPNHDYLVKVDYDPTADSTVDEHEVLAADVQPGMTAYVTF